MYNSAHLGNKRMTLKDGDIVTIDHVEMEVISSSTGHYWFKERNAGLYYYSMIAHTPKEIEDLIAAGRFVVGKPAGIKDGKHPCAYHRWEKYVGAKEVYNFCSKCDAKQMKDWRLIKDDKEY